ncbi:MAG: paraquat-inducible protein A, partial [Spirochaetales bacterium]|nr:paraquat-inducible protein A [Spirochaetales bacterium]
MTLKQAIGCAHCDLLVDHQLGHGSGRYKATCPRCGGSLYIVNGNTLSVSLALVISGCLIMIPAYTMPVFILTSMGNVRMNTLFTGVVELFVQGLWDIALLVLLTSILFPILKLLFLSYTLIGITSGRLFPRTAVVFRWYHYLQEWAMVDVFMLGIMVALTKLDSFADVALGFGFWSLAIMLSLSTLAGFFLNRDLAW